MWPGEARDQIIDLLMHGNSSYPSTVAVFGTGEPGSRPELHFFMTHGGGIV